MHFYLINSIGKSIMVKYSTHYDYYTHWARILITKFIFITDIIIIYINLNEGRGDYVFKNILCIN